MTTRRTTAAMALAVLSLVIVSAVSSREIPMPDPRALRPQPVRVSLDQRSPNEYTTSLGANAPTDTTVLGSWTFDAGAACDPQGWTSVDLTRQGGPYFHVDDFAGLGPGLRGLLYAPQGDQAMWCGARPAPLGELCHYATLPGYGNNWDQRLGTPNCLDVSGDVHLAFLSTWDSEPGYDGTCVEFDRCDDSWTSLIAASQTYYFICIDGWDSDLLTATIPDSLHSSQVRFRIRFLSDGAWSDEDGLWNTDGAIVIDSLSVTDDGGAVIPTELFETESVGDLATASGNWVATVPESYGDFAGLFPGAAAVQEGGCDFNTSCLWGFFAGSSYTYGCGGFPQQAVVPYGNLRGQYIHNEIWSPWMEITGAGSEFYLAYDRYDDNPIDALVYPLWHVRSRVGGCAGIWRETGFAIWPIGQRWTRATEPFAFLLEEAATHVQVSLGVIDMCSHWCGVYGSGECHSHAPLYDNVTVYRVDHNGPLWSVRDVDLFQDTFSADGTTTGTARIDAALDILPSSTPAIRPGDSTTVRVAQPEDGLAIDPHTGFGAAVYMYASVWNGGARAYTGAQLSDDTFRWPVVDSLSHGGHTWYCMRMDTAFADGVARTGVVPDAFCVDLNDDLFVPGDTICFVFGATSDAPSSATTYWSPNTGVTDLIAHALDQPAECTILPVNGGVLYVDGMNFRGSQPFVQSALDANFGPAGFDRYDIRGPTAHAGNRPGARVVNATQQLVPHYRAIIWDTGDLSDGLIGDGTAFVEKSDDASMLLAFLEGLQEPGGVYFSGDNIAGEWQSLSGSAIILRDTYIEHVLVGADHKNQGLAVSPCVVATDGGCFDHFITGPDTMVAYGGCPVISRFDVIAATGAASEEMAYDGVPGKGAVVAQFTQNPSNVTVGVFLSGFSFYSIRDDKPCAGCLDRVEHLHDILTCLGLALPIVDPASPTYTNTLAQNYPNPFNPTTAIEFTLRERAPVTLRIYNVRGQRVTTLVDDTRAPGIAHRIEWDGHNAAGQPVASGVYFYRLVTKDYTQTRKMVLLK